MKKSCEKEGQEGIAGVSSDEVLLEYVCWGFKKKDKEKRCWEYVARKREKPTKRT